MHFTLAPRSCVKEGDAYALLAIRATPSSVRKPLRFFTRACSPRKPLRRAGLATGSSPFFPLPRREHRARPPAAPARHPPLFSPSPSRQKFILHFARGPGGPPPPPRHPA